MGEKRIIFMRGSDKDFLKPNLSNCLVLFRESLADSPLFITYEDLGDFSRKTGNFSTLMKRIK
jgi:hypothetical protein